MHLKKLLPVCLMVSVALLSFRPVVAEDAAPAKPIKVALVFDKGGKDDRSFNSAAFRGAIKAKEEKKIFLKYVEATDDNAFESLLRSFAQKDYNLILSIGVSQADAVKKVSAQFPKIHFAIVDAEVTGPNVKSLLFEEHEGSYLAGAAAGLFSKTGKVGFIGGMDIPLIRRFELGYIAGVKKVNPKAKVISNFIGVTGEAWNNPAKAKELAVSQYGAGADVIFAAAGASNGGLFDAAEEQKKFAIGVDSNQNWIKPGFILTSMLKRIDTAVYDTCNEAAQGKFVPGTMRFGLDDQGIDLAIDSYNEKLLTP
ncbi:MAG: BMP family ABC transporter substrate-binding protein, partial [Oligoflexia bacterium]|nr:BMP family ABC transporter substrate-binding protein [Oligoflexia bacterium]